LNHLTQPNIGTMEPVIYQFGQVGDLIPSYRTKPHLNDEEFDQEQRHEIWCKRNKGNHGRNIHRAEAIAAFKEDLYSLCIGRQDEKIFKDLLWALKKHSTDNLTEKIRQAKGVPMDSVVQRFGFEIRQNKICCPFHGEKTPSLHIYENRWTCFGCHKFGDTIDFVEAMNKCSFVDAIDFLI